MNVGLGDVGIWIAVTAGLVSLLSPCVLALVPVYVTYLSGVSVSGSGPGAPAAAVPARFRASGQPEVMANALLFVVGFSAVFIAFGATASAIGSWLLDYQVVIRKVAGILVVGMGLHTMGLLQIPFLDKEARFHLGAGGAPSPSRSAVIGMAFAAGWTPCVGPTLAAILGMAASSQQIGQGVVLLTAYSLGMGIPFLVLAVFMKRLGGVFDALRRRAKLVSFVSGLLMIGIGLMIYTNFFLTLSRYFNFTWWGL